MPFNPESAKIAGSLSKRGPAKVLPPTTKEKLNILYEGLLEDLIINQKDLSNSEKIKKPYLEKWKKNFNLNWSSRYRGALRHIAKKIK